MTPLTLGPVAFDAFEVPSRIEFGGCQRLAVHALPGGLRVVDAMGRDDTPIIWSGVFTGPDAARRVRLLDLLRGQGQSLPLAWDDFLFQVVISGFEARFERWNWIPYRIACVVLSNLTALQQVTISLSSQMMADLGVAALCPGLDLRAAQLAIGAPLATTSGTSTYGEATTAITAAMASAGALLSTGGTALGTAADVMSAAQAAGQIAQAAAAQAFLGRAKNNLARAGS